MHGQRLAACNCDSAWYDSLQAGPDPGSRMGGKPIEYKVVNQKIENPEMPDEDSGRLR